MHNEPFPKRHFWLLHTYPIHLVPRQPRLKWIHLKESCNQTATEEILQKCSSFIQIHRNLVKIISDLLDGEQELVLKLFLQALSSLKHQVLSCVSGN